MKCPKHQVTGIEKRIINCIKNNHLTLKFFSDFLHISLKNGSMTAPWSPFGMEISTELIHIIRCFIQSFLGVNSIQILLLLLQFFRNQHTYLTLKQPLPEASMFLIACLSIALLQKAEVFLQQMKQSFLLKKQHFPHVMLHQEMVEDCSSKIQEAASSQKFALFNVTPHQTDNSASLNYPNQHRTLT